MASSASWANPCPRRGRLLYAPLILVEEEGSPPWGRGPGGEGKKGGAGRGEEPGLNQGSELIRILMLFFPAHDSRFVPSDRIRFFLLKV